MSRIRLAAPLAWLLTATLLVGMLTVAMSHAEEPAHERGKALAFDRNRGNCLSCHMMGDGEQPGNSGPPLIQMKLRFPDREVLRRQIWDAGERNPMSIMPPYGRHLVLTEEELDLVVDYVHSL